MPLKPHMEFGEVHAPVEDADVPFGMKVLIVVLILAAAGLGTALVMNAIAAGAFDLSFLSL